MRRHGVIPMPTRTLGQYLALRQENSIIIDRLQDGKLIDQLPRCWERPGFVLLLLREQVQTLRGSRYHVDQR